jgi:hypothetical protein
MYQKAYLKILVRNFGLYRVGTVGKFAWVFNMVLRLTTPTTTDTKNDDNNNSNKSKNQTKQENLGSSPSCMHEC